MKVANNEKKFAAIKMNRAVIGIIVAGMLAAGTAIASNAHADGSIANASRNTMATGQRRGRNWDGYPNLGGSFELRQTALNAGYNEGSKEGQRDRDKRTFRNYNDIKAYRNADSDYSSKLGDKGLYQRYYRMAFESGYDTENPSRNQGNRDRDRDYNRGDYDRDRGEHRGRDWNRYGSYGGSFELRQTALNAGYNAGIKEGRNDRKKGRRRNYDDFSSYQKATDDYSSKLGDKELYRRYYREGFQNGYDDGYRGY